MQISVFGLGYVGVVSAACLARDGHRVVGVDPNRTKVELLNAGRSPIVEAGLDALIGGVVAAGRLRGTDDARAAVSGSELSLVCVGTPSDAEGRLNLQFVRQVCEEIGRALASQTTYHTVVIRSTVLPGTTRATILPLLESVAQKKVGRDFGLCHNPEFLREGTAVQDYDHPPTTVIGVIDERGGTLLAELYRALPAPLITTSVETAEMVKYVDNAWHALKVAFANEMGAICKPLGIDSHAVMDIFCLDRKLNISTDYLKPGPAFGGSCLPKDVSALAQEAARLQLEVPVLNAILASNRRHIERALAMITRHGRKRIGILGMSFKAGTDDLRQSPMVEITQRLLDDGYDVRLYDRHVSLARLVGANREYILSHIPHITHLLVDAADEIVAFAEVVIVGTGDSEFADVIARLSPHQHVVDLVRLDAARRRAAYDGIAW